MWRLAGKVAVMAGGLAVGMPNRGFATWGEGEKTDIGEVKAVEAGFYGLYVARGGPQITHFLQRRLQPTFESHYLHSQGSPVERIQHSLRLAFDSIEHEITEAARKPLSFGFSKPVYVGATALAAVVSDTFYVAANLGDAQALMFYAASDGQLLSKSLCQVQSLKNPKELERLRQEHAKDPDLITNNRIKGRTRVTRAFGLLDLKSKEFDNPQGLDDSLGFLPAKVPYTGPYLSSTPEIISGKIESQDRFLVLGSSSFWESVKLSEASQVLLAASTPQEASEKLLALARSSAHDISSLAVIVLQVTHA